jgi:hypothetical protein
VDCGPRHDSRFGRESGRTGGREGEAGGRGSSEEAEAEEDAEDDVEEEASTHSTANRKQKHRQAETQCNAMHSATAPHHTTQQRSTRAKQEGGKLRCKGARADKAAKEAGTRIVKY